MTSQTDQIQTLIASINALLGKATPRLPWVMSAEVAQQRQLLAQTRDYLASLAQDLEAPGGWGPVDPESGQIAPTRGPERTGEAEAAQVLQALLLEMQYLKENSLKPLRQELTTLKQQRQTLQAEISTLETQKVTAHSGQQQINQFLETLMERLQVNLSQQLAEALAENLAQVSAGQTSDRLLLETIDGELVADQPQLHPSQRLEQLRLVQSQSDQLLLKLDSTLQTVFDSLQKSVESYRESLAEGLDQMHSLGREGEVIFHALVNHIAQQLGQDTSRYLTAEVDSAEAALLARERLAQLTAEVPATDAPAVDSEVTVPDSLADVDLADSLADVDLADLASLPGDDAVERDRTAVDPLEAELETAELDAAFDLPVLTDADLAALQDEELTVLQAGSLSLGAGQDESNEDSFAEPFESAVGSAEDELRGDADSRDLENTATDLAATAIEDSILNLLDEDGAEAEVNEPASFATDLSSETFDTLFGESAIDAAELDTGLDVELDNAQVGAQAETTGGPPLDPVAAVATDDALDLFSGLDTPDDVVTPESDIPDLDASGLDVLNLDTSDTPDTEILSGFDLSATEADTPEAIDPSALADAEAWLGMDALGGGLEGSDLGDSGLGDSGLGNGGLEEDGTLKAGILGDGELDLDEARIAPPSSSDNLVGLDAGLNQEDTTLDSLFGGDLGQELGFEAEAEPVQDTISSLADLLPVDEMVPDEIAVELDEEDYALAAENEDLLAPANTESELRPNLDMDASLMDQLEADLQALAGDELADPLPGAELEPLNSLLDQSELESLVADLDLSEPTALPGLDTSDSLLNLDELSDELSDEGALDAGEMDLASALGLPESPAGDDAPSDTAPSDAVNDASVNDASGIELDALSDLAAGFDLETEVPADLDLPTEGAVEDPATEELSISSLDDFTADLGDLTLEGLTGLSEPDAAMADEALDENGNGTASSLASLSEASDRDTATEETVADLLSGSTWDTPATEAVTGGPAEDSVAGGADALFETIDFGALGSLEGDAAELGESADAIDLEALAAESMDLGLSETEPLAALPEETSPDEIDPVGIDLNEVGLNEAGPVGIDLDEIGPNEIDLNEVNLGELDLNGPSLDSGPPAGETVGGDELSPDDLVLGDLVPAGLASNDLAIDDSAIDELAASLEVGQLSSELADELEALSAEANQLAANGEVGVWDGLQSDLEEPMLSDLPELEIPELADADPQLETAYLPDPLETDVSDDVSGSSLEGALDDAIGDAIGDDATGVSIEDSLLELDALAAGTSSEPEGAGLMAEVAGTDLADADLSAFAAALSAVPAVAASETSDSDTLSETLDSETLGSEDSETLDLDLSDLATVEDTELLLEFDESFANQDVAVTLTDGSPDGLAELTDGPTDGLGAASPADVPPPVWCLGLDIGTTGLSAVLMDRASGQVYPLYWVTAEVEEKWFRLPMAVWLSGVGEGAASAGTVSEAVGQLAWTEAQQPDAEGVLLTELKPLLKAAVSYRTKTGAEPHLQWSDQLAVPLLQVQRALQQLLRQCVPSNASPLQCETIGLEPAMLQQALARLHAVVVGYPTNWPDTYSFNLREAVLESGLVSRAEQVFCIEDAIAALLSGLPDPEDTTLTTTIRQPSLYNCNWQGGTLTISAGATLTELALVNLPDDLRQMSYADFGQRSFPYAGHGLDQDIVCQLLAADGARQPLTEADTVVPQDWSWRSELPTGADGRWESLQLESLTLPAAGETALADRHRLQQRLQSSPLGLSLLEAARHLKLILQHQSQFQLDLGSQRWLVRRRDLESRIFLPYIQRINRHLNVLLSQQGMSAQAIKQVVCTGGSASLPAIARWLRQKFPNATIVQDTYASDRPQSCSRVAYGLANLIRYPQVLDITRHQYSDYFLLMELLRVFPEQPLPVSGIMHLLEQRGINTKACQLHILALLEGHLPPGLVPTASDRPWISAESTAVSTYQALTAAPLFTKQSNQIYVPNESQAKRLRTYMEAVVAGKVQSLQEPLIAQLAVPVG